MATLIRNATVITADAGRTVHYDASIAVEDDRIAAVGPTDEVARRYPEAEVVDAAGKAVFPGLVNAHTHLLATVDRGILEDFGFPTSLQFPETARSLLTVEEAEVMALLGAVEAIGSGTTCLLEISSDVAGYADALEKTGLRLGLAESISDAQDPRLGAAHYDFSEAKLDEGLRASSDLVEAWHGRSDGRVTCSISPHAPENCSPELLRRSREMAERHDTGYTIHLSQSRAEVEAVMADRGVRPAVYLAASDFLGPRLVAAHCRYVDAAEIAALGLAETSISNNPAIAARRGAAAPVTELLAAGCTVGMGSDNMAEDMVEVMRAGLFLERVRRNDEVYPQPEDVLQWATMGGAKALGLEDDVGSIEPGKKADLFAIDVNRAHLVPTLRIVSAFVHNGQPSDVTDVMVDGRWLMRDRKVLTVDEPEVVAEAERIGHAVWRRLVERYPGVPFPHQLPPHPLARAARVSANRERVEGR